MKAGDVIVEFNGKPVTDYAHLRLMVAQTPPKTSVTFKVLREGKEKIIHRHVGGAARRPRCGGSG